MEYIRCKLQVVKCPKIVHLNTVIVLAYISFIVAFVSGQQQCDKEREEPSDPGAEVLPTGAPNPTAGLPTHPETFTPAAPKCPTPTGKTTTMATKTCTERLTKTETFKACKRVLGKRFTITEAVAQCVADICVSKILQMLKPSNAET